MIDSSEQFQTFLAELQQQSRFVFDIETTGLDPLRAQIVGFAFCWKPGTAYYLPLRAPAADAALDPDATLQALKPIFEDPASSKVNQNIKYDQMVLAAHGVTLAHVVGDPMIAHYLLEPGARSHGLDDLVRDYLNHTNIKIEELIGKGKKQICMDAVPTVKAKDYACEDADTAFQLAARFEPLLEPSGLRQLYDTLEIPLIDVLAEMERNGISLNVAFLNKLGEEMAGEVADIEQRNLRTRRTRVPYRFAKATPGRPLRRAQAPDPETHRHQAGAEHRPGVTGTARRARSRFTQETRGLPAIDQAQGHLRRRPADARQPEHTADSHVL